jgi:hypothetical protein
VGLSEQGLLACNLAPKTKVGCVARTARSRYVDTKWGAGFAYGEVNNVPFADSSSNYAVSATDCDDYKGSPISESALDIQRFDKSRWDLISGSIADDTNPT